jgi:hypothetical protein
MKWMNYSLAFAAGKAKKDLAIGLKPLNRKDKENLWEGYFCLLNLFS